MNRATNDASTTAGMITTAGMMTTTSMIATTGMIATTIMIMDTIDMSATDMARISSMRAFVVGSIAVAVLAAAPLRFAEAAGSAADESDHDRGFVTIIKRDAKKVGAAFKEGAHRVAVASKAVGHEVATAAKRSAAETRAAFRGQKPDTPAS